MTDPSADETIGLVNINYLDPQLQSLITSMHFTNNMLPIFLSYDVYATAGAPILQNCCIGGYHNALGSMQTYIWTTQVDEGVQGGFSEDVSASSKDGEPAPLPLAFMTFSHYNYELRGLFYLFYLSWSIVPYFSLICMGQAFA